MFESVHATFQKLMRQLAGVGNVLRACTAAGLLQTFQVSGTAGRIYSVVQLVALRAMHGERKFEGTVCPC
jgi:hypothetical protein